MQWIAKMTHPSINVLKTRRLIADIRRVVDILNADIAAEEEVSGISDPSRPDYPILARALSARRANLESTLASLELRSIAS